MPLQKERRKFRFQGRKEIDEEWERKDLMERCEGGKLKDLGREQEWS